MDVDQSYNVNQRLFDSYVNEEQYSFIAQQNEDETLVEELLTWDESSSEEETTIQRDSNSTRKTDTDNIRENSLGNDVPGQGT
jgi:hypothetical protein